MMSRYDVARGSTSVDSLPQIPDGCRVIHLNLVVSLLQYIFLMCSRLRPVCVQVNSVTNSHHIYNLSILCRAPFELGIILVCNAQTFYILYSLRSKLQVVLINIDTQFLLRIQTQRISKCIAKTMHLNLQNRPTIWNVGSIQLQI